MRKSVEWLSFSKDFISKYLYRVIATWVKLFNKETFSNNYYWYLKLLKEDCQIWLKYQLNSLISSCGWILKAQHLTILFNVISLLIVVKYLIHLVIGRPILVTFNLAKKIDHHLWGKLHFQFPRKILAFKFSIFTHIWRNHSFNLQLRKIK